MEITGTIFSIQHFSLNDGPGIRTVVFMKGCSQRCLWCHNPEGLNPGIELRFFNAQCTLCGDCIVLCPQKCHQINGNVHTVDRRKCNVCGKCVNTCPAGALTICGEKKTPDEILNEVISDRVFYKNDGGVTFSGGEPLMQPDFVHACMKACRQNGIHTAVETSLICETPVIDLFLPVTDLWLADCKAVDETLHKNLTGQGNRKIIENLKYLTNKTDKIILRIPVIPECNICEMEKIAGLAGDLHIQTVQLLEYHSLGDSKYPQMGMTAKSFGSVSKDEMSRIENIFRSAGLKVRIE